MRKIRLTLASCLILLGFVASGCAFAGGGHGGGHSGNWHGGHGHGWYGRYSVSIGIPFGWGYGYYPGPYYYPPYYPYGYYPPVAAVPYEQPSYIEQGGPQSAPPQAAPAPASYWYYCAESKSYYPYVNQCPAGWQRVSPTPPSG